MCITKIINSISFIFTSIAIINISNSATINLNFNDTVQSKCDNQNNTTKYRHTINYKKSNGNQVNIKFYDFDETNTKVVNEIKEKFDDDFIITSVKSYPVSVDGNYTLNGKTYNINKEFGLPISASNLLLILDGVSISSNIENISIVNNSRMVKPIVLIYYDKFYLGNDLTIKCSRIPYINLSRINDEEYCEISEYYFRTCKIKSIESLSRYTVFQFNAPIEINNIFYSSQEKVVIKGKRVIPYDNMIWD